MLTEMKTPWKYRWKSFKTITKTIEIFYLHSSKGIKKVFHKLLQLKLQRYKEDLERYKNVSIDKAEKQWHTFINHQRWKIH